MVKDNKPEFMLHSERKSFLLCLIFLYTIFFSCTHKVATAESLVGKYKVNQQEGLGGQYGYKDCIMIIDETKAEIYKCNGDNVNRKMRWKLKDDAIYLTDNSTSITTSATIEIEDQQIRIVFDYDGGSVIFEKD